MPCVPCSSVIFIKQHARHGFPTRQMISSTMEMGHSTMRLHRYPGCQPRPRTACAWRCVHDSLSVELRWLTGRNGRGTGEGATAGDKQRAIGERVLRHGERIIALHWHRCSGCKQRSLSSRARGGGVALTLFRASLQGGTFGCHLHRHRAGAERQLNAGPNCAVGSERDAAAVQPLRHSVCQLKARDTSGTWPPTHHAIQRCGVGGSAAACDALARVAARQFRQWELHARHGRLRVDSPCAALADMTLWLHSVARGLGYQAGHGGSGRHRDDRRESAGQRRSVARGEQRAAHSLSRR
jgi:hypothetical protein